MRSSGVSRAVHLLFEQIHPTHFPLLEKGHVKLVDSREVGVEAPCGHAEAGTEVRNSQGVHAAFGEEI
jgi:3,4-dihydroxy-2-butanone 4-phosphate synthase